jgi:ribosomal protein S18 acetylase RimI-like enzyme
LLPHPQDCVIRPAGPADVRGIAAVHVRAWQAAYAGIVPEAALRSLTVEGRSRMWAKARLGNRPAERPVFVATAADAVVGMIAGGAPRDGGMPYDAEIYAINIDPDYWRRGIGRRLFLRSAEHLAATGARSLYLWVLVANLRGRRFYESLAGEALEDRIHHLEMGGVQIPEIAYGWRAMPGYVHSRP